MESAGLTYTWEPYVFESLDSLWNITVFRVYDSATADSSKNPVLFQTGANGIASDWLYSWAAELVPNGYEIWLLATRGSQYGDTPVTDFTSLAEKWDFSSFEQGKFDILPALDVALEVTGKSQGVLVGYSMGTTIMFSALASRPTDFADKVQRFIPMATCLVMPGRGYDEVVAEYARMDELGFLNYGGGDEAEFDATTFCDGFTSEKLCGSGDAEGKRLLAGEDEASRVGTVKGTYWYAQMSAEETFQEPIPLEDYAMGIRTGTALSVGDITVPVSMVHPISDESCTLAAAQAHAAELTNDTSGIFEVPGTHGLPAGTFDADVIA